MKDPGAQLSRGKCQRAMQLLRGSKVARGAHLSNVGLSLAQQSPVYAADRCDTTHCTGGCVVCPSIDWSSASLVTGRDGGITVVVDSASVGSKESRCTYDCGPRTHSCGFEKSRVLEVLATASPSLSEREHKGTTSRPADR